MGAAAQTRSAIGDKDKLSGHHLTTGLGMGSRVQGPALVFSIPMVVSCYEEGAWQWAELELGHVCREPGVRVTIENKSCVSARSSCDVAQDVGSWTRPPQLQLPAAEPSRASVH